MNLRQKINLNHNSAVALDDYRLNGATSASIEYVQQTEIINPIGISKGLSFCSGPPSQKMSISRSLYYNDPILDLTGVHSPIKGDILDEKNQEFYGFYSGYLTNYSIDCAVGSYPKVNTTLSIFDEIKSGNYNLEKYENQEYKAFPASRKLLQNSILIESEDFGDNKIVSFNFSLDIDLKAYYGIGSIEPFLVERVNPVKYSASIQLELGEYLGDGSFEFLKQRKNRNLSISINDFNGGPVFNYQLPRASLKGRSIKHSSNGVLVLDLNYIGHDSASKL